MSSPLAPVYLDDARVQLQGDPKPKVAKIMAAGGKAADGMEVVRLRDQADEDGSPLRLEDTIDRAQDTGPVYLRCRAAKPKLAGDESTGMGSVTSQEMGGAGEGDRFDPQSSIGNRVRPQRPTAAGRDFGAGRPGMAGQGATGSEGEVPADKRAKSDFTGHESAMSGGTAADRQGGADQTYGAGDLQPGGRTGLSERPPRPSRGNPDSTQEFQSGGRQGEGLEASYRDEGVGSTGRRQAGLATASGVTAPEQGAQGGLLRDSSTNNAGRQQARPAQSPSTVPAKADGKAADDPAKDE